MVESLRDLKVATPPCAAKAAIPCGLAPSKFEEYTKCPPYDFNHTEDELFYEHRSIREFLHYIILRKSAAIKIP